ncbi:hypothetical protein BT96DRAFT_1101673 [Gymnopus androsaceus JB14]|uniref:DUF6604 domain-containing protein n=1 Tax=Gymnopus androsaceus JB14 TaxID=1447944 RepID=A0A6A4HNU0_9AGAR|nr:hypothetical protein BT96DRAFT_1101673 [Gymnopus androsaceus JB14]
MKNNLAIIISKDTINAANAGPEGGVRIAGNETQGLVGVWKLLTAMPHAKELTGERSIESRSVKDFGTKCLQSMIVYLSLSRSNIDSRVSAGFLASRLLFVTSCFSPMASFSNSPLPNAVETSRSKYKDLTARFVKWLSCRADDMNIASLDELDGVTESKSVPLNHTKTKNSKGRRKKASTPTLPQKSPLPTAITVGLLVKLAGKMQVFSIRGYLPFFHQSLVLKMTNSKVPEAVFTILDQIIDLRVQVGSFYSRQWPLTPELVQSNRRHQYFIDSLRKIRDLLHSCPTSRPDNALVKLDQFMSLLGLEDNSNATTSSSAPILDEDWLPDNLKGKTSKKDARPQKSDRPLQEFALLADDDNGTDEAEMLAWMLFHDFAHLREHLRDVWEQYHRKEITLVTASFLTTQSVEIVKEMEEDFAQVFPGKAEYLDIVKVMFRWSPSLDIRSVVMKLVMEMDSSMRDFTMGRAFHALWQFGLTLQAGNVPCPKPGFFPTFHPEDDRSSMDDEQLHCEDLAIFMPHLAEVAMQCKLSQTEEGRKTRESDGTTVDEHALVRDMRTFIIKRSRPTPLHLIFQWAIYRDIVLVNRKELNRPLDELHEFARKIVSSAKDWMNDYDSRFYTYNDVDSVRQSIRDFIDRVESFVLTDRLGSWKRKNDIVNLAPYQLWHYNPWACGAALYSLLLIVHHCTVQVLNSTGYLGSVVHLYHALRVHERIQDPWPQMDQLLDIVKECAFDDHLPEKGQCLASFWGFMGGDPTTSDADSTTGFTSSGYGTGVLPKDYGGSLPGRLSEDHQYRLTDGLIAELFPHASDGVVAKRSRAGPSSRQLRFGGKRCDTFGLLKTLQRRIESDLKNTALGLDLFAAQRMALSILRRWVNRTKEEFIGCFGPRYVERPGQICFLPGYLLGCMEKFEEYKGRHPSSSIRPELVERIVREAVISLQEGKDDLNKSLEGGARMFYLSN